MARFPGLRRFMRLDRGARGVTRAVDDELQFHFDMTVAELRATGLDEDAARREAERRFGDVNRTRTRLETIDRARVSGQERVERWGAFTQDVRYALRGLRLRPGFAASIVLTLGLGIGANATMFGIVDRLLFRPPAYLIAPERAHTIYFATTSKGREAVRSNESYARFRDILRFNRSMDVVGAYSEWSLAIGEGTAAHDVDVALTSSGLWRLFDTRPVLGRLLTADDDSAGAPRVVVLSYQFWQSEYGGAPDVLGKKILINDQRHTIVGVAPPGFTAVRSKSMALFIPLGPFIVARLGDWYGTWKEYNSSMLSIYGRRRAGISAAAADADLTEAFRRSLATQHAPHADDQRVADDRRAHAIAGSILEQRGPRMSANTRVAAWLLGVAGVVLLIACANVGNLLLGRALTRRREIAVRLAIGISRSRLVGQLLIESALLALFGGLAGVSVAQFGGQVLQRTLIRDAAPTSAITDARVLLFSAVCALTAGLLCGLAPVLQSRRVDVAAALKAGARDGAGRQSRLRTVLLVLQAALSVVLLVGAGLFVRSMVNVRALEIGFDIDRLLAVDVGLRGLTLDTLQRAALMQSLLERARANPDAENASFAITVPRLMTFNRPIIAGDGAEARRFDDVLFQIASPAYFATVGTPVVRGRGVSADDLPGAALTVVVSEQFARRAWPGEDPLGKCIRVDADSLPCRQVVGVAADVRMIQDLAGPPDPMIYLPAAQYTVPTPIILVRTRSIAATRANAIRADLQRIMPGMSYVTADPIAANMNSATRSWRLGATMFTVFGGLALVLATIGLYSVVAYGVAQRMHEMGVRVALGAQMRDIVALIVGDGLRVVLVGVALGVGTSLLAGRWIAPLLFKVSPADTMVLGIVGTTLVVVGVVASALPALRAARVDATVALRAD